jgi:seryl-tRNA synthetase
MLQINYIRENKEQVLARLAIKNFKNFNLVDEIIQLDENRRQTQSKLDAISAEANLAAKQVGDLMRQGKKEAVEVIKVNTSALKEQIKTLGDELTKLEGQLQQQLVLLPNLPHISVPKGVGADDNEIIFD